MNWYSENCDGDWEHSYGIQIETIDNPGWSIKIDLADTYLSGSSIEKLFLDNSEEDWVSIYCEEDKFIGNGDPYKLRIILQTFKDFADNAKIKL